MFRNVSFDRRRYGGYMASLEADFCDGSCVDIGDGYAFDKFYDMLEEYDRAEFGTRKKDIVQGIERFIDNVEIPEIERENLWDVWLNHIIAALSGIDFSKPKISYSQDN